MYLIVLNSAPDENMMQKESEASPKPATATAATSSTSASTSSWNQDNRKVIAKKYIPFGCDIVLTIAPRKDAHDEDDQDETVESLIQCTIQV